MTEQRENWWVKNWKTDRPVVFSKDRKRISRHLPQTEEAEKASEKELLDNLELVSNQFLEAEEYRDKVYALLDAAVLNFGSTKEVLMKAVELVSSSKLSDIHKSDLYSKIISHPSSEPSVLWKTYKNVMEERFDKKRVFHKILDAENCPFSLLKKMANDGNAPVEKFIFHPECTESDLLDLNLTPWVRHFFDACALDKDCPREFLECMVENKVFSFQFLDEQLRKSDCPPEFVKASLLNCVRRDPLDDKRQYVIDVAKFKEALAHPCADKDVFDTALSLIYDEKNYFSEKVYRSDMVACLFDSPSCQPKIAKHLLEEVAAYHPRDFRKVTAAAEVVYSSSQELQDALKDEKTRFSEQDLIKKLFEKDAPESRVELLVKYAQKVVESADQEKIDKFREVLFSAGEEKVYEIDDKVMNWFVHTGEEKNLEAVNCLRSLYGLKTELQEYSHSETEIKRILFQGTISAAGENNEFYEHKYSEDCRRFLKYKPDYHASFDFTPDDYHLKDNAAFCALEEAGIHIPEEKFKDAFMALRMPPEIAQKMNVAELQRILLENEDCQIDENQGVQLSLDKIAVNAPQPVRKEFWMKAAQNESLKKFITDDLIAKGISKTKIKKMWHNCEKYGSPMLEKCNVSLQVHHIQALKDGGENVMDNFVIVVKVEKPSFNEKKKSWNEGGKAAVNSHKPHHWSDSPLDYFYRTGEGKIAQFSEKQEDLRRIKIITKPCAPMMENEHVLFIGGPNSKSWCVGRLDGEAHGIGKTKGKQSANDNQQMMTKKKGIVR